MNKKPQLSSKSRKFLEDLRVYLFSSGKDSDEIAEIVEELEVHLMEAEKNGKSTEKIVGHSPKEYMEQLSDEMPVDYKSWIMYAVIIIFGAFSFTLAKDLLEGTLSYSLLELIGHVIIAGLLIVGLYTAFKYIAGNQLSRWKEIAVLSVLGFVPIALFVGLIHLDRSVETPIIHFDTTGTILTAVVTAIFLIAVSWWAKTWVLPIFLLLLLLPDYLFSQTSMDKELALVLSTVVSFGGIGIYLFIVGKMNKTSG
ncbi:hypothetical protein F3157_13990 [Virgibacillus dakarensis]|uniref:NADH dehydrogenase n=1 Tax=Lentibacillus populi TaxID=1827502 RepID=A0A9W5TWT2_9BACI|nr:MULTISPECIES: hypothetical protein [Bacillaceae]MBT2217302.1 hypothetical protein [Virgibacillus dakarensis]MTW86764.1 hypothetical protein [Virgibacillus dakarensis]GGB38181.1 NADH dehydrogenase [Lentibacillus populi]